MYDTKTMQRRQYTLRGDLFEMVEEPFTKTVFSDVLYHEEVTVSVLTKKPRVWVEKSKEYEELFEQVS
jgi:hypothetical protein